MRNQKIYEWAEDVLLSDEVEVFYDFCKRKGRDLEEEISYEGFLELKKEFEQ